MRDISMGGFGRSHGEASSQTSDSTRRDSTEVSFMDYPCREHSCTEWTDEKHSLYLKSMEATFVDQLYSSLGQLKPQSERNVSKLKSSRRMHQDLKPNSSQFKVLHGGFWQGINLPRHETQTNKTDILADRRCQTSCTMRENDLSSCREEVSDQNFVDEEIKCGRGSGSKRTKMARNEPTKDDQVVPNGQRPVVALGKRAVS